MFRIESMWGQDSVVIVTRFVPLMLESVSDRDNDCVVFVTVSVLLRVRNESRWDTD